jgi:hypothetical protein
MRTVSVNRGWSREISFVERYLISRNVSNKKRDISTPTMVIHKDTMNIPKMIGR